MMQKGTEFAEVDLAGPKIGLQLNLSGAKVNGPLVMFGLNLGADLLMDDGEFRDVNFGSACVGGYLNIEEATFTGLVDLRGARVETFLDSRNWPASLYLEGFHYDRVLHEIAKRKPVWFKEWLEKQEYYSPQPYEYLASVLQKAGYKNKANAVLFSGKQRIWRHAGQRQWPVLFFQLALIGYGFKMYFVLVWVLLLTVVGVGFLTAMDQPPHFEMRTIQERTFFTLDMFLPIVDLNKTHEEIVPKLPGGVRIYFYFLKLMGWILALFLGAGLGGLTKR